MDGIGQLGIDIPSIIYYLVNYGVILAILGFYVYPKIYSVLEKRQNDITNSLNNAQKLKKELSKELEKYSNEHKKLLEEARLQKKKGLEEIEAIKSQILAEMESRRSKSLEETDRIIAEKKAALLEEARKEIYGVILRSFHHISRKIPENIIAESFDEAWSHISKTK